MLPAQIIQRTLRVPPPTGAEGDGAVVVRQLDAVLVRVGFACSRELLDHLSGLRPDAAMDAAVAIVGAVRELVGDHVAHNAYFRDFPAGVPETTAFWVDCVIDALAAGELSASRRGSINVLGLRRYGRYRHSFEEMAAHPRRVRRVRERPHDAAAPRSLARRGDACALPGARRERGATRGRRPGAARDPRRLVRRRRA